MGAHDAAANRLGPSSISIRATLIHEARLKKEPAELEAMRRAMAISADAHKRAMMKARGGMREWQIEAEVDYAFRSQGATGPSYPSIIASGPNAATLHYINNDREMRTGELLLIDAGAEYDFYAADITRTSPIGARFTGLQRDLYEIVLDAQLKAIDTIKPGAHFDDPHEVALRVLVDGMRQLGILQGSAEEIIEKARVSAVLHASHESLARHGRSRCGTLPGGRRVASARAWDGAHGRAGIVHRCRR